MRRASHGTWAVGGAHVLGGCYLRVWFGDLVRLSRRFIPRLAVLPMIAHTGEWSCWSFLLLEFFAQVPINAPSCSGTRRASLFADAFFGVLPLVTATVWTTAKPLLPSPSPSGSARWLAFRVRGSSAAFGS